MRGDDRRRGEVSRLTRRLLFQLHRSDGRHRGRLLRGDDETIDRFGGKRRVQLGKRRK
jgi:hypothetical protein